MPEKNKKIMLIIGIILLITLIVGGTYAYLTLQLGVTNGDIYGNTCFNVVYDINNDEGSQGSTDGIGIQGTLFPTQTYTGGLYGKVTMNIDPSCIGMTGKGTLFLKISNMTSPTLVQNVSAHCENKTTLETITDKKNEDECTNDNENEWVTTGSGLKYAVVDSSNGNTTILSVGYIQNLDTDIPIYSNFTIDMTTRSYHIYMWLDGNITDSTYEDLSFEGYIHAGVTQDY